MLQQVATTLHYLELYADQVKDIGESSKGLAQYAACNTTITFIDDDLLLG